MLPAFETFMLCLAFVLGYFAVSALIMELDQAASVSLSWMHGVNFAVFASLIIQEVFMSHHSAGQFWLFFVVILLLLAIIARAVDRGDQ